MRLVGIMVVLLVGLGTVRADAPTGDKALKPYAGKIVVSPDVPPTNFDDIPAFLKINIQSDGSYDVLHGPPWHVNLVAVLSKDPGAKQVSLVFADKADKKLTPMHSIDLSSKRRVVIAKVEATIAAGFAAGKTYVVRVMLGKTLLATADVTLKD